METQKSVISLLPTVIYEGVDISRDISASLLSLTYTDSIDDEADSLDIELSDRDAKWCNTWMPARGDSLVFMLYDMKSLKILDTGKMMVDRIRVQSLPRLVQLSAVSIPLNNTIRRKAKTRNFENTNLNTIAQTIAADANLELFVDVSEEMPQYDRINQNGESDLVFLKRLCKEAGFTVKVAVEKLIIFDQRSYEKKAAVMTIQLGKSQVLSYSFERQQDERYRSCTIRWRNPRKKTNTTKVDDSIFDEDSNLDLGKNLVKVQKKSDVNIWDENGNLDLGGDPISKSKGSQQKREEVFTYTYVDESVEESGQEYVIKKRCTSASEAERLCKAKLRELNLRQTTGNISMIGQLSLYAGAVITVANFGAVDGNYIIERITHSYSSQGYTSSLDIRAINNVY